MNTTWKQIDKQIMIIKICTLYMNIDTRIFFWFHAVSRVLQGWQTEPLNSGGIVCLMEPNAAL